MDEISEILRISKDKSTQERQNDILLQPFTYVSQGPTPIELKLTLIFNHWLNIPVEKLELISEIFRNLYNCCILIDDIEDNSILRKGKAVAHSIYGLASTINSSVYGLIMALKKTELLNHPEAHKVLTEELLEMHRGQGMDIYWRDVFKCPTEAEYKLMAIQKTSGFFMLALRLMQLFSENTKDFSKLINVLGLYYQIQDDYCNLSMEEADNKGFYEDLTEGKFSFPIVHAVQNQKSKEVLDILRQRTSDVETKKYCINLLEELGSLKYTRDVLEVLDREARKEAAKLGPNALMEDLFDKFLTWKTAI